MWNIKDFLLAPKKVKVKSLSRVQLFATPWTAACQVSLSFTIFLSLLKLMSIGAFLVAQSVKNPPAMRETGVQSLGWEDPLEKGTATHPRVLAWRTPQTV